ncbi:MAG: TIGR03663 family protein, partial [bacterium]
MEEMNTQSTPSHKKGYWTLRFDWYRLIFAAIVIFTVFTRFYSLGYRPYDHDESLAATCSWYVYEGRGYEYNPLMHGPFIHYFDALLFHLFGPGDYVARASSALFGLALVCCAVLFRRRLGKAGSLIAAALFAVSPIFMYFSRLFRDDIFVSFWAFLTIALFLNYLDTRKRGYLFGSAASFALVFCVKENSYVFLFIFTSFWAFMKVFERLFPPDRKFSPTEPELSRRLQLADVSIAIIIFFSVFFIFFTSFFSNPGGFWDGLYRKSLGYWLHQDKIQRMKGAFTYYCPLAIVYELPLIVILFSGLVGLLKQRRLSKIVLIAGSVTAIPLMIFWHRSLPTEPWDTRFHMTSTLHLVFALYIFALLFAATCDYLRDG